MSFYPLKASSRNFKWRHPKPTRDQLGGFSSSEFKTLLKRLGYPISRDFFKSDCSIVQYRGCMYRFRYWGNHYNNDTTFVVDISCPVEEFDRWANSVEETITFTEWLKLQK